MTARQVSLRYVMPMRGRFRGPFLQCRPIGGDRLVETRHAALALAERLERSAEIVLRPGPLERDAHAGPFLQRRPIGGDRLLETRRAALALAERGERIAEIVLRPGPVERNARAGPFLQRRPKGGGRLLETRRAALALAEPQERCAEIVLRRGPVERDARAGPFLQRRAIGGDHKRQHRVGSKFANVAGRNRIKSKRFGRPASSSRDAPAIQLAGAAGAHEYCLMMAIRPESHRANRTVLTEMVQASDRRERDATGEHSNLEGADLRSAVGRRPPPLGRAARTRDDLGML